MWSVLMLLSCGPLSTEVLVVFHSQLIPLAGTATAVVSVLCDPVDSHLTI